MLKLTAATVVRSHPGYVQLNVGIPRRLDHDLRQYARAHGVRLNHIVIVAVRDWLDQRATDPR